ncbi:MAG: soluble NSF attachment family protein, partial [Acidobacteria bacterium]|nr:soluble NSF attachment family protein [Acidobacteriota bacterium]
EEGASLLWESFKNPTSDISVMFALKFAGVTPAFQAKLKVNWDKVYTQHDIKLHAEGTIKVVKLQADVRAILEELRQKGAIQLEVVGENQDMQKMLDVVYGHLLSLMCEKVPMGPGEATGTPAKKSPGGATSNPIKKSPGAASAASRLTDERYRGGPYCGQEQVESQQSAGEPCDESSRRSADLAARRAVALNNDGKLKLAIESFQKAYEACSDPKYLLEIAKIHDLQLNSPGPALDFYRKYIDRAEALEQKGEAFEQAQRRLDLLNECKNHHVQGGKFYSDKNYVGAIEEFEAANNIFTHGNFLFNLGQSCRLWGEQAGRPELYERAVEYYRRAIALEETRHPDAREADIINDSRKNIDLLTPLIGAKGTAGDAKPRAEQASQPAAGQGQQTTTTGQGSRAESGQGGTKPPATSGNIKPPAGKTPDGKTPSKPAGSIPEVKPIVSVSVGYSFKRVKMSGNYEVDMRKRLREDRDIVMSGNIGGIYQKYGEDRRFFSIVSLDDPTFQERSVEVILDGQDAADFKSYINAVSVLFRKQRFSGPPLTGEVKFFDQQFAQNGNRLSFRYGRLNEASTEWLDYEYKPKWSLYGGVEWEGEWTKTSDSVLTLSPPVRRRKLEISVDEDNILKSGIKALAVQVKHRIYGREILKEVVINYDKGDPLQANYAYVHEDGNLGYSYKVVWLFLDGREVHTEWLAKESPFIYAVYAKK